MRSLLVFLALALAAGPALAQQPDLPPGVTPTPAEARVSWADVDRFAEAFERLDGAPDTAAALDPLYLAVYRRRLRLRRAAGQVTATGRALSRIAHAAGYADHSHMCREIRDTTGLTPSRLRELAHR